MACLLVPAAEALVVTVIAKIAESKKADSAEINIADSGKTDEFKIPFARKVKWLINMLWGGSALLAFEHVWHGEIVPWFPFLTAAGDAAEASVMLHEMATVGVTMAVFVTAVWGVMLLAVRTMEKAESAKKRGSQAHPVNN